MSDAGADSVQTDPNLCAKGSVPTSAKSRENSLASMRGISVNMPRFGLSAAVD
jgi:hypothetical protein